jgi:hypothetical protein
VAGFLLHELRGMPYDEVVRLHDEEQKRLGAVGVNYYLQELERRDNERHTQVMLGYTNSVRRLTWVIAFLTLVNVALTAVVAATS